MTMPNPEQFAPSMKEAKAAAWLHWLLKSVRQA
jgi:hypothetical protein